MMEDASILTPEADGMLPSARRLRSVVIGLIALLSGCDQSTPPAVQPHPVGVVTLSTQRVPVHVPLPGRVSARRVAEVRPQVSGILLQRRFPEGAEVKAGDPLYLIDPAPYQAALAQATGNLARSRAAAAQAYRTASRYRTLLGANYISQQDVDMATAQARQAEAQVTADRAAVDRAKINLNYTNVRAPVDGVIGKSFFTEGALVTDGQPQPMTVIQQLDPVYVDLTEDSDAWLRLQQELHYGTVTSAAGRRLPVTVNVGAGKSAMSVNCSLLFSDVTVDVSTGSLVLRAQCPNPEHTLLPGMFVRAVVSPGVRENALLVPQQAVSRTPDGQATVMVVDKDNRAQLRPVRVTEAAGDQWRVTEGLSAGEQVVVTGQLMLRPGMPVTVRSPVPAGNVRTGSLASRDAGLPADEAAAEEAARKEKEHA
ncbi:efflux RND transporter periplasmic adaptor subunit [Citrobacter koseri]|uniref:efflux RND transporter periplasmic adaptor subunit n=1 Tax=Citrobacter koseri TaxID=545 RepID=UPI001E46771F|nr:efflux RND transporter periplasmic adaptor subunit [Citrobacter koseri]